MSSQDSALERFTALERVPLLRAALTLLGVAAAALSISWVIGAVRASMGWPAGAEMELHLRAAEALSHGRNPYAGDAGYAYPPLFADLMALLSALFGPVGAAWLWVAASVAALFSGVAVLTRNFGVRLPWHWIAVACGVLLLADAGRNNLYHGQFNFALLALLAWGYCLWRVGRDTQAAFVWAAMIGFQPLLAIVVVFLAARRDWHTALATLIFGGLVFGFSFLPAYYDVFGTMQGWREASAHLFSPDVAANPLNQSFYGVSARLFSANEFSRAWADAPLLVGAFAALFAGFAVALFWRLGRMQSSGDETRLLLSFGSAYAALLSIGPATQGHNVYVVLPGAVAAFALVWRAVVARSPDKGLWLATGAAWVLAIVDIWLPTPAPFSFLDQASWSVLQGAGVLLSGRLGFTLLAAALMSAWALAKTRPAP